MCDASLGHVASLENNGVQVYISYKRCLIRWMHPRCALNFSRYHTLDESDETHDGTSKGDKDRLVRASHVGAWGDGGTWGDLRGTLGRRRLTLSWLRGNGRWLGATLSWLRCSGGWLALGWHRRSLRWLALSWHRGTLRWLALSWLLGWHQSGWDYDSLSWHQSGWDNDSWLDGVGSESLNVGLGDAVGLGHDDGVGVGHWDNDGGVGRDDSREGHRAGGGSEDLGGLVGGGDRGCVVNNGSWDLGDDGGERGLGESHWDTANGRGDGVWARDGLRDVVDLSHDPSGWLGGNNIGDRGWDLGDNGGERGLGESHWDAADGRGDGVWARNSLGDVVGLGHWHSGWLGGNNIGNCRWDLDRHDGGGRVDLSDDLAGLGDGLGNWAQRGGVLGLNGGRGFGRVRLMDRDWNSGVDNRRDSRDSGECFDLGVATLSPEKLLEYLPFSRLEVRYNGI